MAKTNQDPKCRANTPTQGSAPRCPEHACTKPHGHRYRGRDALRQGQASRHRLPLRQGVVLMEHAMKTWPEAFAAVKRGDKRAELRADDRQPPFAEDDTLVLQEYEPGRKLFTGATIVREVTHVSRGGVIPDGFALLSLRHPFPTKMVAFGVLALFAFAILMRWFA